MLIETFETEHFGFRIQQSKDKRKSLDTEVSSLEQKAKMFSMLRPTNPPRSPLKTRSFGEQTTAFGSGKIFNPRPM
ncbi:MAG: hypothetical protein HN494_04630 [Opitutae bacterium]|jgi:hypothetical protein|nr:hypothetical protein [Opitutae bacterium]MBT7740749.1 hypothetical protein [Opitutae bacterium]MBT7923363.1 hypothetical protein [Opitutae bacterium]